MSVEITTVEPEARMFAYTGQDGEGSCKPNTLFGPFKLQIDTFEVRQKSNANRSEPTTVECEKRRKKIAQTTMEYLFIHSLELPSQAQERPAPKDGP
jgi:hypothetical protein